MASMKDLFPLHDYRKKNQKNFIKENIKKVKGCNQCFLENKMQKTSNSRDQFKAEKLKTSNTNISSIKCNVKVIKRGNSPCNIVHKDKNMLSEVNDINLINQSCQTDSATMPVICQTCGQAVDKKKAPQKPVSKDSNKVKKEFPSNMKKDLKKSIDLTNYKKGVVPKYLKERNAKLELEQKEKEQQEKLIEVRGLNDPKCPPGHMLMPKEELQKNLCALEAELNALITQMNMMPVSSDSYRVKQRKIQIEKAMKELEDKIELFKTGKVFIKIP